MKKVDKPFFASQDISLQNHEWSAYVKSSKSHTHTNTKKISTQQNTITGSKLVRARNSQPAQQNTSKEIISSLCYTIIFAMDNQMVFKFE